MFFKKPALNLFKETSSKFSAAKAAFGPSSDKVASMALVAGAASPFLMNDEDNFLSNTLVAAPVIGGAFLAGPHLQKVYGRVKSSLPEASRLARLAWKKQMSVQELEASIQAGRFRPTDLGLGNTVRDWQNAEYLKQMTRTKPRLSHEVAGDNLPRYQAKIEEYFANARNAQTVVSQQTETIQVLKENMATAAMGAETDTKIYRQLRKNYYKNKSLYRQEKKTLLGLKSQLHGISSLDPASPAIASLTERVKAAEAQAQTVFKKVTDSKDLLTQTKHLAPSLSLRDDLLEAKKVVSRNNRYLMSDTGVMRQAFDYAYQKASIRPGSSNLRSVSGGTLEEFFETYQHNKSNPVFAQNLYRKIKLMEKHGVKEAADLSSWTKHASKAELAEGLNVTEQLKSVAQRLEAAGFTSEAQALTNSIGTLSRSGAIDQVRLISRQVTNQQTGEVLSNLAGVRFMKSNKGQLDIGLTINGQIYTGKDFSRRGMARPFFTQDGAKKSQFEFAMHYMGENKSWREIQTELKKASVFHAGGDLHDLSRSHGLIAGEGTASARRSMLPDPFATFKIREFEGSFAQLRSKHPTLVGELAADMKKAGKVLLSGSDNATLAGHFLDPAIEQLEIHGIMDSKSQSPVYRSLKPVEMAGEIPSHLLPITSSGYINKHFGGANKVNRVRVDIGGYSHETATLFGSMSAISLPHIKGTKKEEITRWAREAGISGSFQEKKAAFEAIHPDYDAYLSDRLKRSLKGELGTAADMESVAKTKEHIFESFRKRGVSREKFESLYSDVVESSSKDPNSFMAALDYYGGHGETEFTFNKDIYKDVKVRVIKKVELDRLNKVSESLVRDGKEFGKRHLGWNNGKPVLTTGASNRVIENYVNADNGKTTLLMEELHDFVSESAKGDVGVKSLMHAAPGDVMHRMVGLKNMVATQIPGVETWSDPNLLTGLAPQEYLHASGKSSAEVLVNHAVTVSGRAKNLEAQELKTMAGRFEQSMVKAGFELKDGRWEKKISQIEDVLARQAAAAEANKALFSASEELLSGVGGFITNHPELAQQDSLFSEFITNLPALKKQMAAVPHTQSEMGMFMRMQHFIAGMAQTDNTHLNAQKSATVTPDVLEMGMSQGKYAATKELVRNTRTQSGEPIYFDEVWQHLQKETGLTEGIGRTTQMSGPIDFSGSRSGTVFDPSMEENYRNRSVRLNRPAMAKNLRGEMVEQTHLQLVSMEGFGGQPLEYMDKNNVRLQATDLERAYNRIAHSEGLSQDLYNTAVQEFNSEYANLAQGKKGHLRAKFQYNAPVPGFMRTRISRVDETDVVYISQDIFEGLKKTHPHLHAKLEAGEDLFSVKVRTPASALKYERLRWAGSRTKMGANQVQGSEMSRIDLRSDSDGDRAVNYILESEEAAEEFKAMSARGGEEWKRAQTMAQLRNQEYGGYVPGEDIMNSMMKSSLYDEAIKSSVDLRAQAAKIAARWEGTYVGHFSNMLDRMRMAVQHAPDLRFAERTGVALSPLWEATENVFGKDLLEPVLFQMRQVPIQKAKDKMDLAKSQELLNTMTRAWNNRGDTAAHDEAIESLRKIALGTKETTYSRQQVLDMFPLKRYYKMTDDVGSWVTAAELAETDKVNLTYSLLDEGSPTLQDVKTLFKSDKTATESMFGILSRSGTRNVDTGRLDPDLFPKVARKYEELGSVAPELFARVGRSPSATRSAQGLGAINEMTRSIGKELKQALKPAMPLLALGAGVALLAGALSTPDSRRLAGAPAPPPGLRPEQAIGQADAIGDEVGEGSYASSPPRDVSYGSSGVRTVMVSPMRHSYNAEVRMSGDDRSSMAEVRRQISGIFGDNGSTHVTNNYHDSWNSGGSRLRRRDRVQKELDRYDR